ncbi:hypothetical protein [Nonomuraea candida]|uniref:hypothetical protein n=1 Tax=Nonomuraea candida TaxID=359159 RepID=UPI000AA47170|nr:hypothetical protein [Nonomuraea candida]
MNFCLSDLVPPLRWSDASTITLLTGQPELPDAWWRSLPMPSVLAAIGPEPLGELLTEIALEHWPAAAVGDVLPALHVLDPEEADEPAVAIALDRAGSWAGLLALTSRELVDQPFIQARPVLNTLFSAVLARLAHPYEAGEPGSGPREEPFAPEPVAYAPATYAAGAPEAVAAAPERAEAVGEVASEPVAAQHATEAAEAAEAADERPAAPALAPTGALAPAADVTDDAPREESSREEAPYEDVSYEGSPSDQEVPADQEAAFRQEEASEREAESEREAAPGEEPESDRTTFDHEAEFDQEPAPGQEPASDREETFDHEEAAEVAEVAEPDEDGREEVERVVDADAEPVTDDEPRPEPAYEPERAHEAEPVLDAADEPASDPAALEAAAIEAAHQEAGRPEEAGPAPAGPDALEAAALEAHGPEAGPGQELPELIEAAFAGLDDKSWAVAQNRVFTDEPSAVDQLAKLFAVSPAEIVATEDELRARLGRWLASDEAAPYRAHLDELVRTLGPGASKEQLIGAADWHRVEIRALEVPAWQVVLATLAPPAPPPVQPEIRPAARPEIQPELPPPPLPQRKPYQQQQPQPPVELVQSAFGPVQLPPPPPPGPPQFQAFTPVTPPGGEANGGAGEHDKPYQPLKDVSQTRRCFRQPDGRWWLRIDVTAEQLAGGECALPTGFASYLGLSPGESRTVRSAAGELTMTWHGRPVLESIERLLVDVGAREGGHLFLTLSDEGVLRARHLPVAAAGAEKITKALRLVGYTAPGGTRDQAARVIATRIGMTGPVALPDLLNRLRERGDRDLLDLLG